MRSLILLIGAGVLLASASQASSDPVRSLRTAFGYHAPSGSKAKTSLGRHGFHPKHATRPGRKSRQSHLDDWHRLIKLGAKKIGGPGCWVSVHQANPSENPGSNPEEPSDPAEVTTIPDVPTSDTTADDPLLLGPETSSVTAVPLPAALPLFAGGLGLLGWLARRRRKSDQLA